MDIRFLLNGEPVVAKNSAATTTLLDWLRIEKTLTGTKEGCNEGDCGACTVIVIDEKHVRSLNACILFLPQLQGKAVRTVEGIKNHVVQKKMVDLHGSQCGFCTPGFITSMVVATINDDRDHNTTLAGNLCRCTGYAPIIRAAVESEGAKIPDWVSSDRAGLKSLVSDIHHIQPNSKHELAELLDNNPNIRLIAGATDVGLWVTKQFRDLGDVAFLNQIRDFDQIEDHSTFWRIGAGITIESLRIWADRTIPNFAQFLRRYASTQVRNAATLGGNIANGSPIGDSPPALIAMGANLTLTSVRGSRQIALKDFFIDYGKQDIQDGEFVEFIDIPKKQENLSCYKISKRFDQDISAVCGCLNIEIEDGIIKSAKIAFGGMAGIPKQAEHVEQALVGMPWTIATIDEVSTKWELDFSPLSDARGSAEYRLKSAKNLLTRYFYERTGENTDILQVQP